MRGVEGDDGPPLTAPWGFRDGYMARTPERRRLARQHCEIARWLDPAGPGHLRAADGATGGAARTAPAPPPRGRSSPPPRSPAAAAEGSAGPNYNSRHAAFLTRLVTGRAWILERPPSGARAGRGAVSGFHYGTDGTFPGCIFAEAADRAELVSTVAIERDVPAMCRDLQKVARCRTSSASCGRPPDARRAPARSRFPIIGSPGRLRAGVSDGNRAWFVCQGDGLPGRTRIEEARARSPGVRASALPGRPRRDARLAALTRRLRANRSSGPAGSLRVERLPFIPWTSASIWSAVSVSRKSRRP